MLDQQPEQPAAPASYTALRMQQAGIPADANQVPALDPNAVDGNRRIFKSILTDNKDGDMQILYVRPDGEIYTYDNGTKNDPRTHYTRIRYREPQEVDDGKGGKTVKKYGSPYRSRALPFFPPQIIAKVVAKTPIETLYMVEGELKAFAGACRGLDIIGLPSNQPVYQDGSRRELHEDIRLVINACAVKNLVLLHDADARAVTWKVDKDLAQRPQSFAAAVRNFREACQPLLDAAQIQNVFYMHGLRKLIAQDAKGLDDMFAVYPDSIPAIIEDLQRRDAAVAFFAGQNLTPGNHDRISQYFGVGKGTKEKPTDQLFYEVYREDIGPREYIFRQHRYQLEGEEVKLLAHEDTTRHMRVNDDWYKMVARPTSGGGVEEEIVPRKVGEIMRDYLKRYPNFLEECPKYEGFGIFPDFSENYKRVVQVRNDRYYNMYSPLMHVPKPGQFDTITSFLKHIFGGVATLDDNVLGDPFTVAMDWWTLLLQKPMQMLPVIVLVSPENETGKSTFLDLLTWVFGSNACILNNDQFAMKFNGHYATKFIIGLDESFQDLDKKAEKERLKQMVTAKDIYVENKGVNVQKIPFYAKLVMCSNEAERIMRLEEGENRWFVVRVPKIKKKDPLLGQKMQAEIPAFIDWLQKRKVFHPLESRLWFGSDHFITEQFNRIVEATKPQLHRSFEEMMKEKFLIHKLATIKADPKTLAEELNTISKWKVSLNEVRQYLKETRKMEPNGSGRFDFPIGWDENQGTLWKKSNAGRWYEFRAQDWLSEQELEGFVAEEPKDDKPF
jgi:hypothetical protein